MRHFYAILVAAVLGLVACHQAPIVSEPVVQVQAPALRASVSEVGTKVLVKLWTTHGKREVPSRIRVKGGPGALNQAITQMFGKRVAVDRGTLTNGFVLTYSSADNAWVAAAAATPPASDIESVLTEGSDANGLGIDNLGSLTFDPGSTVDFTGVTVDFTGATVTGLETVSTQTSNYTPGSGAETINVTGNTTITLPPGPGGPYTIVKADNDADEVTVTGTGGDTINGSLNYVLNSFGQWIKVIWDGSNWAIGNSLADAGTGNNNPASLTGLLAYWTFDSATVSGGGSPWTVADQSASGIYDLVSNNPSPDSFTTGKFGDAFVASGGAQTTLFRSDAGSAAFEFGSADFSISLWHRYTNTGVDADIFSKGVLGAFNGWAIRALAGGTLRFGATTTGSSVQLDYAGLVEDGNYHHIVVRRSGNTFTLWFDGTQRASTTNSGTLTDSGLALHVAQNDANSGELTGRLDDMATWTGATHGALTDGEIAAIYNGGTGRQIN